MDALHLVALREEALHEPVDHQVAPGHVVTTRAPAVLELLVRVAGLADE